MSRMRAFQVFAGAVLLAGLGATHPTPVAAADPRVITIEAKRFEFNPKEITLKAGETVTLQITSSDVTHGFFSKPLGIDEVIEPGQTTTITLTPKTAGRYVTICDHFCGTGHGGCRRRSPQRQDHHHRRGVDCHPGDRDFER